MSLCIYSLSCFILKLVKNFSIVWEFNRHNWLLIARMLLTPLKKWLIPGSEEEKSSPWPQETNGPDPYKEASVSLGAGLGLTAPPWCSPVGYKQPHRIPASDKATWWCEAKNNFVILSKHRQKQGHSAQRLHINIPLPSL